MELKEVKNFSTSDTWLASVLMALGEQVSAVERNSGSNRVLFVFEHSETIFERVEAYKCGKLQIEPQHLFIQNRLLKNRLYSEQ